jgi:anti-sigma regulatory factor (Ser/Thr protein kinase)
MSSPLTFTAPRDPSGPAFARGTVESALRDVPRDRMTDILLAVSELVTNAVRHGEGEIEVHIEHLGDRLRLEVVDEGDAVPEVRREPAGADGGWGLQLIDAVALRWGSYPGTTHVWCEIPLRRP